MIKNHKLFKETNSLSVWLIPQSYSNLTPSFRDFLSTDELERASKYHFDKDHIRFVNRRGMVRLILGNYLRMHPKDIKFEYTKLGKPYIKSQSTIKFSITSSVEFACFAVSNVDVGIDIEKIIPFENLEANE